MNTFDCNFDGVEDVVMVYSEATLAARTGIQADFNGDGVIQDLDIDDAGLTGDEIVVFAVGVGFSEYAMFLDHMIKANGSYLDCYYTGGGLSGDGFVPNMIGTVCLQPGEMAILDRNRITTTTTPDAKDGAWFVCSGGHSTPLLIGRALGGTHAAIEDDAGYMKRFYVDGHEYNVVAVKTVPEDEFKFITIRTPVPKVNHTIEQHSQDLEDYPVGNNITVMPPFNYEHTVRADVQPGWTAPYHSALPDLADMKYMGPKENRPPLEIHIRNETNEPRFYGELREMYNRRHEVVVNEWMTEQFWTRPDQYTEFELPGDQYYLLTSSWYAPQAVWRTVNENNDGNVNWYDGNRVMFWYNPDTALDLYVNQDTKDNRPKPTGPQDKSLVQVEGQPEVYWFQNGRLYWVTDWNVINDMSGVPGWGSVNTLPASEFNPAGYPQGPRFITTGAESDGLLIRQVGDYKVYRIENGKKRHITYPDVMDLKGYSFDDVIEVSSEISDMFPLGDPIGIEVDLYFNKKTDSGDISHVSQFTSGETVKSITETTVAEDYTVETYVRVIFPDGTEKYAYRERSDFLPTDPLLFSDTERPLYPGTWHAQTKTWNWDEYTFAGDEVEGVYTWEFWYEDVTSGKVLGKDVQGYEFTITTPPIEDTTPPFILIISPIDGKTVFHSNLLRMYGTAFDLSGIETLTVNGQDVIFVQAFGVVPFYTYVDLKEGLNEITILAKDASENHNEKIEEITVNYYPFDVKITSPNDLDRLIPGESINGEVVGGTPPFAYKWIINEVEYPGTSDYIFSESGKYEVKLEVTDHVGYTINAEEKQVIISPLNVGTTFGFMPNPNGYQFGNFISDDYSWEMFRNTYGADQVELPNGDREPRAEVWYNGNFRHAGDSGTCFGMSASSLVIYQKDNGNNNYISWDLGDDIDSPLPSWPFFPSFVSTPKDWVEYYQPLQNSAAAISDKAIYNNPIIVYDELKLRMASVWIEDPMIIGMEWMITDVKGTGHAVVPYKIEESADHRTGKVFIYDSKYPGEEGHFISFNLATNVAKNDEYTEGADLANVRAIELSSVQKEKTPLRIPNLDSVTSYGHLLYTDAVGRHYGFSDGEFTEEIPGITHIIHWGQDEYNQFLETYCISDLNLKRELYGIDNGIATVSIFRPNNLVVADVQVSPSSVDELHVPPNGSSVEFVSGEGTSTLSLMLDRENTDMARLARINMSGIESGSTVQLLFSDDLGKVGVVNKGSQKGCTIYLEQIGLNSGSFGSLKPIMIEENSAAWFIPSYWGDLANNPIVVEHDIGNDGTIEYTEILTPPSAASTTPTGAPSDTYSVDEDVYAAGSGFATGTNVDIYVVQDQDWNDGDPILQDVTGSVEAVPVVDGDVGPVLVWHAPLVIGEYDIVIDANQNGVYDASTDGLDSGSPGFVVIGSASVPVLTPIGIIALIGLLCVAGVGRIRRRFN